MVKKIGLALLIAVITTGGVFALDLSAGFGGTFRANFLNRIWTSDGKDYLDAMGMDEDIGNANRIGGGFFAYFDATYVALTLGLGINDVSSANSDLREAMKDAKMLETFTTFDIGLLGKFPIALGGFTLFPALGVELRIPLDNVSSVDGKKSSWSDISDEDLTEWMTEIWFKFGVGADIPLGQKLYLRSMFLYGFGSLSKADSDSLDLLSTMIANKKLADQINHGFDISLALGFKF